MTVLLRCAAFWLLSVASLAAATQYEMRIRTGNPFEEEQTVAIKEWLPFWLSTNDITEHHGLQIGFDPDSNRCFAHGNVDLPPKAIRDFSICFRDAWTIPIQDIRDARTNLHAVSRMLLGVTTRLESKSASNTVTDVVSSLEGSIDYTSSKQRELQGLLLMVQPSSETLRRCLFRWALLRDEWLEFRATIDQFARQAGQPDLTAEQIEVLCSEIWNRRSMKFECPVESWILTNHYPSGDVPRKPPEPPPERDK